MPEIRPGYLKGHTLELAFLWSHGFREGRDVFLCLGTCKVLCGQTNLGTRTLILLTLESQIWIGR